MKDRAFVYSGVLALVLPVFLLITGGLFFATYGLAYGVMAVFSEVDFSVKSYCYATMTIFGIAYFLLNAVKKKKVGLIYPLVVAALMFNFYSSSTPDYDSILGFWVILIGSILLGFLFMGGVAVVDYLVYSIFIIGQYCQDVYEVHKSEKREPVEGQWDGLIRNTKP